MNSLRHLKTYFYVLILLLSIFNSCSKKNEMCNQNLSIQGSTSVVEGEDVTLTPVGYSEYQEVNTYFYWEYPDMSGYNNTVSGMEEVYDTDPITIEDFDIRDEGDYFFRIASGNEDCDMAESKHTIDFIPKTSPCFEQLSTQYIVIEESFSPNTIYQTYSPSIPDSWDTTKFQVDFSMPLFSYYLKIEFDIPIPDYSSTYKLRNSLDLTSDDDPIINAHIEFCPDNEPADTYRTDDLQHDLYLKREGNMMYLSFCNVVFTHQSIPSKTITISGKVELQL